MHVDARAQDEIRKRQFSEVPSLKWGNKTYKLKMSIVIMS